MKYRQPIYVAATVLLSLAVSIVLFVSAPHESDAAAIAGGIGGTWILLWTLSGIGPVISSRGFKPHRVNGTTFVAWGGIIVLFGTMMYVGQWHRVKDQVTHDISGGKLTVSAKENFTNAAIRACVVMQTGNPQNIQASVSPETIASYCRCVAEQNADAITESEMNKLAHGGSPPDGVRARALTFAAKCAALTMH